MAGLLAAFLRESAGRSFDWGVYDCYWWSVDWLERRLGPFADGLRAKYLGRYSDAQSCFRIVHEQGGFEAVAAELASAAGLHRIDEPEAGDLVTVRRPGCGELVLGICASPGRVAVKNRRGIAVTRRTPAQAWGR